MKSLLMICCLWVIMTYSSNAEEPLKGKLTGSVTDKETMQPLQGVTIRLNNTNLGAISDSKGEFTINNIGIGIYTVSAAMIGYDTQTLTDVEIVTKRTARLKFELGISSIQTEEITVGGGYFHSNKGDNSISKSSINNGEIRRTPGTPDVFRRLQFLAGVGRSDETTSALIVRGGDPEENLTLIENIEVFSPFHFASLGSQMAGSMSVIEPKLVENIDISTGGFSSEFGDKLSSVTEIKIKEPDRERINLDLSVDLSGISGFVSGPITSDISAIVAARRGILDLMLEMMDEKFIPKTSDFHSKIIFNAGENHKLSFYCFYSDDSMIGSHEDGNNTEKIFYSDIAKNQAAMGITWQWLSSANSFLKITPFANLNKWRMSYSTVKNKDMYGGENIEDIYGLKCEYYLRLNNNHKFSAGFQYKSLSAEYKKWSDFDTLSGGEFIYPYSINFEPEPSFKVSSWIDYSYLPASWITFNLGLRGDYFRFIDKLSIDPRAALNLKLTESTSLNFACGLYSQFPDFYKISLSDENTMLKPAKALHYISGIEYLIGTDMMVKAEAYYKNLYSVAVTENDTSRAYFSSGSGYAYGLEFSITKKFTDELYFVFNYTYSESKRKDKPGKKLYYFRYDRPNMINLMTVYKPGEWWEIGLTAAYSTGMPYTPYDLSTRRQIDGIWYCDLGEKNSVRFPDYFRVDLRVEKRFVFESWNLRAYLELWNITNHKNIFEYNYSNGYSKKEENVLFPLMPIIGLAIEL